MDTDMGVGLCLALADQVPQFAKYHSLYTWPKATACLSLSLSLVETDSFVLLFLYFFVVVLFLCAKCKAAVKHLSSHFCSQ